MATFITPAKHKTASRELGSYPNIHQALKDEIDNSSGLHKMYLEKALCLVELAGALAFADEDEQSEIRDQMYEILG